MDSDFSLHFFWWPFIIIFCGLLFLVLRDRIFFRKKKLIRIHKYNNKKSYIPTSNDSGIIFISKIVKPQNIKEERSYAIPKTKIGTYLSQIRYNGLFDVKVIIQPYMKDPSITLKGDKAFVDIIDISTQGDYLEIKHPQISCNYDLDCQLIIRLPLLISFHNKGRGQIDIEGICGEKFSFYNYSIENSYLSGTVVDLQITSRSKGDVFAQQLSSYTARVDAGSIGDIYCHANNELHAKINHSGNIYVKDLSVRTHKMIDGSGKVIYRPFEDNILNFIFVGIQRILQLILKK
jgi:hypothetical protein